MTTRKAVIKQTDLSRIAKVMQASGVAEWRVEIDPASGKIAIIAAQCDAGPRKSDWD